MPGSATLSDLLGYTSIACWLGAQFPQVLKNIQRQSCEGISLPFLANWLLGDFSNLIGCILTHQLPFQKWLATYFVCVDLVLVIQYFYYPSTPTATPSATSYSARAVSSGPDAARRLSLDRGTRRYRTLSAVAANVAAAAAALAAQQDEDGVRHTRREANLYQSDGSGSLTSHIPLLQEDNANADPDEDGLAALADSFHSEGGRNIGRKRVAWSAERHGSRVGSIGRLSTIAPSLPGSEGVRRGRSLQRSADELPEAAPEETLSHSTIANRRNSRAGKKSATMVFLGAWALFGVGTLVGSRRGMPTRGSMNIGRVLSPLEARGEVIGQNIPGAATLELPGLVPSPIPDIVSEMPLTFEDQDPPPGSPESHDSDPVVERVVGRIFAWLCTTLYLTSRLPQIWKNYVRQSVEGLSMYLFVFAFLGNVFYVCSILSSPKCYLPPPASTEFLKESIPYLLGSGGTLMFDITIVTQSFLYRSKPKRRYTRGRSDTLTVDVDAGADEERAGLLAGDALGSRHQRPHPLSSGADGGVVMGGDVMPRGRTTQTVRSLTG